MAYIGKSPTGTGVRSRYHYTAAGSETSLSGADDNNKTLTFTDGEYVDVYVNGVLLFDGDYNTNTANTISGLSALVADDVVEVVVYDVFTVADTVSAKNGGTFSGNVTFDGAFTSQGIDDNATSTAMTLDSSGNLLVGTTNTLPAINNVEGIALSAGSYGGRLEVSRDGNESVSINRMTSDGSLVSLKKDGTTVGSIGTDANSTQVYLQAENSSSGYVGIKWEGGDEALYFVGLTFRPSTSQDNRFDIGRGDARFDDIFATNGSIQTSDENEKQQIASLTANEITAAKAISKLFKTFKWNSSVTENGDNARTHTGVIAQQVETALTDAGLDPSDYAFYTSYTWTDDDGNSQTRKGIRYNEILSFVGAATEQRLADLETRVQALENA